MPRNLTVFSSGDRRLFPRQTIYPQRRPGYLRYHFAQCLRLADGSVDYFLALVQDIMSAHRQRDVAVSILPSVKSSLSLRH